MTFWELQKKLKKQNQGSNIKVVNNFAKPVANPQAKAFFEKIAQAKKADAEKVQETKAITAIVEPEKAVENAKPIVAESEVKATEPEIKTEVKVEIIENAEEKAEVAETATKEVEAEPKAEKKETKKPATKKAPAKKPTAKKGTTKKSTATKKATKKD